MRLHGFARALHEQLDNPSARQLDLEDRVGILVDREWTERESRQPHPPPPARSPARSHARASRTSTSAIRAASIAR